MNLFGFVENLALKVSKTTLIAISFFVIVLGVHKGHKHQDYNRSVTTNVLIIIIWLLSLAWCAYKYLQSWM